MDDESKSSTNQQPKVEETKVPPGSLPDSSSNCADDEKLGSETRNLSAAHSSDQMNEVVSSLASVNLENKASDEKGQLLNYLCCFLDISTFSDFL